jgi:hypothetical protein
MSPILTALLNNALHWEGFTSKKPTGGWPSGALSGNQLGSQNSLMRDGFKKSSNGETAATDGRSTESAISSSTFETKGHE